MNRHQAAHAIVFDALTVALFQAFGDISTSERHRLAEIVCEEAEAELSVQRALHPERVAVSA